MAGQSMRGQAGAGAVGQDSVSWMNQPQGAPGMGAPPPPGAPFWYEQQQPGQHGPVAAAMAKSIHARSSGAPGRWRCRPFVDLARANPPARWTRPTGKIHDGSGWRWRGRRGATFVDAGRHKRAPAGEPRPGRSVPNGDQAGAQAVGDGSVSWVQQPGMPTPNAPGAPGTSQMGGAI